MTVAKFVRRLWAFPHYWRSIKTAERNEHQNSLDHYDRYRNLMREERPSDRALHAKLLILNGQYEAGSAKLSELVRDLEKSSSDHQSRLTAYIVAWSKMTLAGLRGDQTREKHEACALSLNPPAWLQKLLPVTR